MERLWVDDERIDEWPFSLAGWNIEFGVLLGQHCDY